MNDCVGNGDTTVCDMTTSKLRTGRIRTQHQGRDEEGRPWPLGYTVRDDQTEFANCIYCVICGVAVAETWRPQGKKQRHGWCTRQGEIGHEDTAPAALMAARVQVAEEGYECECSSWGGEP